MTRIRFLVGCHGLGVGGRSENGVITQTSTATRWRRRRACAAALCVSVCAWRVIKCARAPADASVRVCACVCVRAYVCVRACAQVRAYAQVRAGACVRACVRACVCAWRARTLARVYERASTASDCTRRAAWVYLTAEPQRFGLQRFCQPRPGRGARIRAFCCGPV